MHLWQLNSRKDSRLISQLHRYKRLIPSVLAKSMPRVACCALLALGGSGLALAQDTQSPLAAMTTQDLGAFFDDHIPREMGKADVAGSVVAVVRDGQLLFARGYGFADVGHHVPVSARDTLFRIASLSKVVSYTAVMQLVEQGKIDLDADVARYLDFPIPAAFGKPITMRHLMSHTAGFEETVRGRWVAPGELGNLRDYLVHQMPKRIFAPGTVPAYSTYGTTLAGHIVERASGKTFEAYVERHIFDPLGMHHSSFAQPLPVRLAPLLAKGYVTGSGAPQPFDTAQVAPAASMSSTAVDMARFMLAHLGGTDAPGSSLLKPATLAQMHAVQFRHHPAGPGIALGLYEMDVTAPRVIGHTGDIPNFHSAMYLVPDQRIGLFIAQNTEAGPAMRRALLKQFVRRYLARQPAALPVRATADGTEQMQGSYRSSWRFDASPLSLRDLLGQDMVRVIRPGSLAIGAQVGADGKAIEWHEVGNGVWQSAANPQQRRYFRRNAQGDWEMSSNQNPTYLMQKTPWHQHRQLMLSTLVLSLAAVLLSVLAWPLSALRGLRSGKRAGLSAPLRTARRRIRLFGLVALSPWVVYGGIGLMIANDLLFVASPACAMLLRVVQALAWLAVAGTIGALWTAARRWRTLEASWIGRTHHALLALACLGASVIAWQGGLLVWDGKY